MLKRAITGLLFVITLLAGVYYGKYTSFFLFLTIIILGVDEFFNIAKKVKEIKPIKIWGILVGMITFNILALIAQQTIDFKYLFIIIPLIFLTFIIELYRKKEHPFINISYTILGTLYIVVPFAMLYHLGFYSNSVFQDEYSYQIIIGFFIMLWANDTGAYLAGKYLGKHKLFERISPKKTWEGSLGGGLLSIALGYIISLYFTNLNLENWIVISIIIVVFGGIGDLVESMLKRSIGVKDSGNILPGHGGILDRFDGLLISVPFVYFYLQFIS
jgi:phosphatidate cytidylyltransferase